MRLAIVSLLFFLLHACSSYDDASLDQKEIARISSKLNDGYSMDTSGEDEFAGFYQGVLWMMYELEKDAVLKVKATECTDLLLDEQFKKHSSNLGLNVMISYGNAYRLTQNTKYRKLLIQEARCLISRFDEKKGCILSRENEAADCQSTVFIKDIMNLELLFWAWKETGEQVYYNIAVMHAMTTMRIHFKSNYSCLNVACFDSFTNDVSTNSHMDDHNKTLKSIDQAWALYGYTMIYRDTKENKFLQQAEKIADYIINGETLPKDYIPYTYLNAASTAHLEKNLTAASIIASALYELSVFSSTKQSQYINIANNIIDSLSSFPNLDSELTLKNPSVFADYYFLEAIKRKRSIIQ